MPFELTPSAVHSQSDGTPLRGLASVEKPVTWAIAWDGFPHYARALVDGLATHIGAPQFVLIAHPHHATKSVPLRCGVVPKLIGPGRSVAAFDKVPDVFLFSGWSVPRFVEMARFVYGAGGRTICTGDNIRTGALRHLVRRLIYRSWYSRFITEVLVPGTLSQRYFEYLGQPNDLIHCGLYTVDDNVFAAHRDCRDRDIDVLYVGQFIPRKGIDTLAKALNASPTVKRAVLVGGVRDDLWFDIPGSVSLLPFVEPDELSRLMKRSKVFVLPSVLDHWGVVVLEAAQSGCLLAVSNRVGAKGDLIGQSNGAVFPIRDHKALGTAITRLLSADARTEEEARAESVHLASRFCVSVVAERLAGIVRTTS